MGDVIVTMWVTLDGFVAGPNGGLDWVRSDAQMQEYEQNLVDTSQTLLLGRVTHAEFSGYWPGAARDEDGPEDLRIYAQRVDTMDKVVVSSSGDVAEWDPTRRLEKAGPEEIGTLKEAGPVLIYGSVQLVRALADQGLVDQLHLLVHPTFLREGKRLFEGGEPPVTLSLDSTEQFPTGVVLAKYRLADGN